MKQAYNEFVSSTFDELKKLFIKKSAQYGDIDPLGNFRKGAALKYNCCDIAAMYEVLKDYLGKHIVHVYGHPVNGGKVDESWKDIAVYSVIALYLNELYYAEQVERLDDNEQNAEP